MNSRAPLRWDIFCRVIDNFGDIGVTWRLARQLAAEHGRIVRVWVDDLSRLHALCPGADATKAWQVVDGVEVFQMSEESGFARPAEVVVEAFGCGLPENYLRVVSDRPSKPLWVVLEYLSAEPWVSGHHGLPSPHPRLALPRYFYFPGFGPGTGGLLREADLLQRREAFDGAARQAWWARLGFDVPSPDALVVSLFAYPHAPVQPLLQACANSSARTILVLPDGPIAREVRTRYQDGSGHLQLRYLPFLPQVEYDALLWACDINLVRGEDSFVRAQWAGRPFVWHIYPQAEEAHRIKLEAFLDVLAPHFSAAAAQAIRDFWHAWNSVPGAPPLSDAWTAFCRETLSQSQGRRSWEARLLRAGDLAAQLVRFCQKVI